MIPATRYGRAHRRIEVAPFMLDRWRPLRLVLDDASVRPEDIALFRTFAGDDELEVWHTRGDVDPHVEIRGELETPFPLGGSRSMLAVSTDGATLFGIHGVDALHQLAVDVAAESGESVDAVFEGFAFATASEELDTDGFVTERSYLLERQGHRVPVTFRASEALALIGLARRAHGNDSLGRDMMGLRLLGSTYHFVLERELLREGWPWFSGVVSSGHANNDDALLYLAQTARERFVRVLQIRDRLHSAAKGEPTRARGDEIVFQLETLLMFLSASFDATARVAHAVYLDGDYREAGWRREPWRTRLRDSAPDLAALADDATRGGSILQIVGVLRNTIHGEGLRARETRRTGELPTQLVRVTEREGERLRRLLIELDADLDQWGIHERSSELDIAADRFIESLVPEATALLNTLMAATETTRLPGAADQPSVRLTDGPTAEWWNDMLSWEIRTRVRLLSGL